MATRKAAIAFVMDPIEKVDIGADTSFALMLEAQRRGHRVYYAAPEDLGVDAGRVTARVKRAKLRREAGRHVELEPARLVAVDEELDLVFQRKDPRWTRITSPSRRSFRFADGLVLNRPEGILAANEKLYALHFPELMPTTCVTRDRPKLIEFMKEMGGEMIVKPLHGKGGEGILPRPPGRPESVLDSRAVDRVRDPLDHGPGATSRPFGRVTRGSFSVEGSRSARFSGSPPRTRPAPISTSGDGR